MFEDAKRPDGEKPPSQDTDAHASASFNADAFADDGAAALDFAATASMTTSEWQPVVPVVPKEAIEIMPGNADAEDQVTRLAEHRFDAANEGVSSSHVLEAAHREEADREQRRRDRIEEQQRSRPELRCVLTNEQFGDQCTWHSVTGWLAVVFLALLLLPIPLVVAQGIAQSYAFEPIADDWLLGIPFGIPALAGIMAASLLRQTLRPAPKNLYDRIIPVLGVAALIAWAAGLAFTFLTPVSVSQGFAAQVGPDLTYFYFGHLCLELMAALGLTAMAERCFTGGRKVKVLDDEILSALDVKDRESGRRRITQLQQAETYSDRDRRLAAAKAAYVSECLTYLRHAETRRNAAMAKAALPETFH